MKTLELKILSDSDNFKLDYHSQLLACVRAPMGERGMDIEEMRKSIRVMDVLEKSESGKWIDLEDADYEHLKQKVGAMRWTMAHRFIVQFVDDVNNAPAVKKESALGTS